MTDQERRKIAEFAEAVEQHIYWQDNFDLWAHTMSTKDSLSHPVHRAREEVRALAAQLKEQPDE